MQQTTEKYQSLLENEQHSTELRAIIGGETYDQDQLVSCSVTGGLFSDGKLSVGGCVSREIDLSLWNPGTIPRMAEIRLYVRLVLGGQASEWIPKGIFYLDTRSKEGEILTLHGYDAMLKGEQVWLTEDYSTVNFPMPMSDAVKDIASRLETEIDERTKIRSDYVVEYPIDYTMREVLSYIAAAHGGNWIITDAGKLRLVTLIEIPPETHYLIEDHGSAVTFGGVRILV